MKFNQEKALHLQTDEMCQYRVFSFISPDVFSFGQELHYQFLS